MAINPIVTVQQVSPFNSAAHSVCKKPLLTFSQFIPSILDISCLCTFLCELFNTQPGITLATRNVGHWVHSTRDPLIIQHKMNSAEDALIRSEDSIDLSDFATCTTSGHQLYAPVDTEPHLNSDHKGVRVIKSKATTWHRSASTVFKKLSTFWADTWTAEILSCGLALIAFICLISTLRRLEGGVLTNMPLKISINTLVAVYAGVIKASLLFPVTEGKSKRMLVVFYD